MAFLCLISLELHLPDNASLKGKRKEVKSLRAHLIRRFGAAVAETDHHDLWQRGTLTIALVGAQQAEVGERADALQRFAESRLDDQVRWDRKILTTAEVWEH